MKHFSQKDKSFIWNLYPEIFEWPPWIQSKDVEKSGPPQHCVQMFTVKLMLVCWWPEKSDKPKSTKLNVQARDKDQSENSLVHLQ